MHEKEIGRHHGRWICALVYSLFELSATRMWEHLSPHSPCCATWTVFESDAEIGEAFANHVGLVE